jgi:hypothetical protein
LTQPISCHESKDDDPGHESEDKNARSPNSKTAARFFWATILVLAGATIGLTVAGAMRTPERLAPPAVEPLAPSAIEISPTMLESILSGAARKAEEIVAPDIDAVLQRVYEPSYAAIPAYAEFHYSILGEYTEITEAALGKVSDSLYKRLFSGFDLRFKYETAFLDKRYAEAYRSALKDQIADALPEGSKGVPLGEMTQSVLRDAMSRAKITLPLATVAAGIAGSGALKAVSATIAKKIATKIAAKAAVKGAAKGGGVLAGVGGGALLCSWSGPGAAACGLVGGAAAWFLADGLVVNIDEYFNRDEFEAELKAMIDEDKAEKRQLIEAALQKKAAQMDKETSELIKDFTLQDLSTKD